MQCPTIPVEEVMETYDAVFMGRAERSMVWKPKDWDGNGYKVLEIRLEKSWSAMDEGQGELIQVAWDIGRPLSSEGHERWAKGEYPERYIVFAQHQLMEYGPGTHLFAEACDVWSPEHYEEKLDGWLAEQKGNES